VELLVVGTADRWAVEDSVVLDMGYTEAALADQQKAGYIAREAGR